MPSLNDLHKANISANLTYLVSHLYKEIQDDFNISNKQQAYLEGIICAIESHGEKALININPDYLVYLMDRTRRYYQEEFKQIQTAAINAQIAPEKFLKFIKLLADVDHLQGLFIDILNRKIADNPDSFPLYIREKQVMEKLDLGLRYYAFNFPNKLEFCENLALLKEKGKELALNTSDEKRRKASQSY